LWRGSQRRARACSRPTGLCHEGGVSGIFPDTSIDDSMSQTLLAFEELPG